MARKKTNRRRWTARAVLAITIVLAAVLAIGYGLYQKDNKYLPIKEWGVQMNYEPPLRELSYIYTPPTDTSYDASTVTFVSELPEKFKSCRTNSWTISRLGPETQSPLRAEAEQGVKLKNSKYLADPDWMNLIKKVGSHYYRNSATNPCSSYNNGQEVESSTTLGNELLGANNKMFESLQSTAR